MSIYITTMCKLKNKIDKCQIEQQIRDNLILIDQNQNLIRQIEIISAILYLVHELHLNQSILKYLKVVIEHIRRKLVENPIYQNQLIIIDSELKKYCSCEDLLNLKEVYIMRDIFE